MAEFYEHVLVDLLVLGLGFVCLGGLFGHLLLGGSGPPSAQQQVTETHPWRAQTSLAATDLGRKVATLFVRI